MSREPSTMGIKQLLDAEAKAQKIVDDARKAKNALMKRAQDEAAAEIEAYRQARQREFDARQKTDSGSSEGYSKQLALQTEEQIKKCQEEMDKGAESVVLMLLKYVGTVDVSYQAPTW